MVQISDLGQPPDGAAYLVMELLIGEALHARLRRLGGRLPLEQALDLGVQIAAALAVAHEKGIVHRDRSTNFQAPVQVLTGTNTSANLNGYTITGLWGDGGTGLWASATNGTNGAIFKK